MSNEYKEWEEDRKDEAWNTLHKIIEIVENPYYDEIDRDLEIYKILEEGGWL